MKALTICQPYAHLIAIGAKPVENRVWSTAYRGELAIHAGLSRDWLDEDDEAWNAGLAFGAIVAIATLTECLHIRELERRALALGGTNQKWFDLFDHPHTNGPWCLVLERVHRLRLPVACRGARQIWTVPEPLAALARQMSKGDR